MSEGTTIYCGDNCNHTGPHRYEALWNHETAQWDPVPARAATPAAPYEPVPGQSFVKRGPASLAAPEALREVPAWLEHTIDTLERGGGSVAYISIEHLREVRAALAASPAAPDEPEIVEYDPGPEVDDEGGASEHRSFLEPVE